MVGDINHIIVIESLEEGERATGTEIFNDTITSYTEYHKASITNKLHNVSSAEGLIEILKFYEVNSEYMNGGILIHLEMHGSEDLKGLRLSNNELIEWKELVDSLRPINIQTCNKLYLSLATCNGRYLYKGVDSFDKSPYSCFISASQDVKPDEIINQYTILFEHLIEHGNIVESYLEMGKSGTKFFYKDSKTTFDEMFKSVEVKMRSPENKKKLLEETEIAIKATGQKIPEDLSIDDMVEKSIAETYIRYTKSFEFDC